MANEAPFDVNPGDYAYAPANLDVASTLALGHRLLSVAPADLPASAVGSRELLRTSMELLGHAYGLMQTEAPMLRRPIDMRTDTTWRSIKSRLDPMTWQLDSDHKDAAPARELARKLFPGDALTFINLEYNAQWAEANWRIQLLQRENLVPLLRRVVGDYYVDQLLLWHERYTVMLGMSPAEAASDTRPVAAKKSKAVPGKKSRRTGQVEEVVELAPGQTVGELRRRALQAIAGWQITLVALHLNGHKTARAALAPTDEFRARAQSSSRTPDEPDSSNAPSPEAPGAPEPPTSPAAGA